MSSVNRKTYKILCEERNNIIRLARSKLALWAHYSYTEELLYIRQSIEKDMTPYEIVMRMKIYKNIQNKTGLPEDIILHIASFGNFIDTSAMNFIIQGIKPTIDDVG